MAEVTAEHIERLENALRILTQTIETNDNGAKPTENLRYNPNSDYYGKNNNNLARAINILLSNSFTPHLNSVRSREQKGNDQERLDYINERLSNNLNKNSIASDRANYEKQKEDYDNYHKKIEDRKDDILKGKDDSLFSDEDKKKIIEQKKQNKAEATSTIKSENIVITSDNVILIANNVTTNNGKNNQKRIKEILNNANAQFKEPTWDDITGEEKLEYLNSASGSPININDKLDEEEQSLIDEKKSINQSNTKAFATALQGSVDFTKNIYGNLQSGVGGFANSASNAGGQLLQFASTLGPAGAAIAAFGGIALMIGAKMAKEWDKLDKATSDYSRQIGGGGFAYKDNRHRIADFINKNNGLNQGITTEEAVSAQTNYSMATGRAISLSDKDLKESIYLNRFGVTAEQQAKYQDFGNGPQTVAKRISDLYSDASKKGLAFQALSKKINDNIQNANTYTFADGIKGLTRMAEKASALNYDMQQVFKFAEKVSTLEGSIQTSAGLSVLGGSIAQYANPLAMLNEGLNDVEALNDRMTNMVGGLSHWNARKGEIETSAINKVRLRAVAEQTGMDYGELLKISQNKERGRIVESQARASGLVDEDVMTFLKNKSVLDKEGNATYTDNFGNTMRLDSLQAGDIEKLKTDMQKSKLTEGKGLEDIYGETMSISETLQNISKYLDGKMTYWMEAIVGDEAGESQKKAIDETAEKFFKGNSSAYKEWENGRDSNLWGGKSQAWHNRKNQELLDRISNTYNIDISGSKQTIKDTYATGKVPNVSIAQGPSHSDGGIKTIVNGRPAEIEGGEAIINKKSTIKYNGLLNAINNDKYADGGNFSTIGHGFMGILNDTMKLFSQPKDYLKNNLPTNLSDISVKPISLNIAGTIKLDLDGQNVDIDANKLLKSPMVMKALSDEISKTISIQLNKAYSKDERLRKGYMS